MGIGTYYQKSVEAKGYRGKMGYEPYDCTWRPEFEKQAEEALTNLAKYKQLFEEKTLSEEKKKTLGIALLMDLIWAKDQGYYLLSRHSRWDEPICNKFKFDDSCEFDDPVCTEYEENKKARDRYYNSLDKGIKDLRDLLGFPQEAGWGEKLGYIAKGCGDTAIYIKLVTEGLAATGTSGIIVPLGFLGAFGFGTYSLYRYIYCYEDLCREEEERIIQELYTKAVSADKYSRKEAEKQGRRLAEVGFLFLGVAAAAEVAAAEAGVAETLEAGVAETLEAGAAETLEAGVAETLEAGAAETLEAGAAETLEAEAAAETLEAEAAAEAVKNALAKLSTEKTEEGVVKNVLKIVETELKKVKASTEAEKKVVKNASKVVKNALKKLEEANTKKAIKAVIKAVRTEVAVVETELGAIEAEGAKNVLEKLRWCKLKPFTKNNYRHNASVYHGKVLTKDIHVHHKFPQKFRGKFAKFGINIDNPRYLDFLERTKHMKTHGKGGYNNIWHTFFENNKNKVLTKEMLFKQAEVATKAAAEAVAEAAAEAAAKAAAKAAAEVAAKAAAEAAATNAEVVQGVTSSVALDNLVKSGKK